VKLFFAEAFSRTRVFGFFSPILTITTVKVTESNQTIIKVKRRTSNQRENSILVREKMDL
jgi:hypothetical protein